MSDSNCELCDSDLDAGLKASFARDVFDTADNIGMFRSLESFLSDGPRIQLRQSDGNDARGDPAIAWTTAHAGRYQLLSEIGRGGMGTVFLGRDTYLGCDLAIKILRQEFLRNPAARERFVEEAQIAGQLQHPGIVPIHDLGQFDDGRFFITMKLVKGRTLADLLADRCHPTEDRTRFLGVFLRVCQTLAYAHARGVIHRDLKPANIMVGSFGEVQVMDWGLAKVLDQEDYFLPPDESERELETTGPAAGNFATHHGTVMGTPAYISPEQARGDVQCVNESSDVFGLGAILCEILTGAPPYRGEKERHDAHHSDLDDAYARLDGLDIDVELRELAKCCLAAVPQDRPAHAGQLAEELSAYLESVDERIRKIELENVEIRAVARHERKMRWMTLCLAATVLIWAVLGGAVWLRTQRQRQQIHVAALVNSYFEEGSALARRGKWSEAADAYTQVLKLDPQHLRAMFELSPLLVELGEVQRYNEHCQYLLTHAHLGEDPSLADRAAKSCMLMSHEAVDAIRVDELVDRVLSADEIHWATKYFQLLKALHAYRRGEFAVALAACEKSRLLAVGSTRDSEDFYVIATDHAIEAMAHRQLGRLDRARLSLSEAENTIDARFPKLASGELGENWNDWLIAQIMLGEAKQLISATK